MKILVADKISPLGVNYLKEQPDFEVLEAYGSTPEQVRERVGDAQAVIVRSETKITAEVLEAAPVLKAVGRAGVGVDNIDIEAATQRGVVVVNTPGGNTIATAELTFTHMLCAARPITQANIALREGRWDRKQFAGSELFEKTLGILGLGRIGREVAKRAKAFGMQVLSHDPYLTEEQAQSLEVEKVDLDALLRRSDYITVHMPLTDSTRHMIDREAIAMMKHGTCLLNCARGGIIKEEDLMEALKTGKVRAAGLDVYEAEPLPPDHPLRQIPNIVLTPHLGASTREAQESVGLEVAKTISEILRGGVIRNAINMPSVDAQTLNILRPYLNLGRKLGSILQQISQPEIKQLRVTYQGKITERDTMPLTRSIQRGFLSKISGDSVNDVNAPHIMKRLGIQCELIKSGQESDYNELIQVEALSADDTVSSIAGTLIGRGNMPRVVLINDREVEVSPEHNLLVIENEDTVGIVGMLGTVLGRDGVNIANMSLSRNAVGGVALSVLQLDNVPSAPVLEEIVSHEAIKRVNLVEV